MSAIANDLNRNGGAEVFTRQAKAFGLKEIANLTQAQSSVLTMLDWLASVAAVVTGLPVPTPYLIGDAGLMPLWASNRHLGFNPLKRGNNRPSLSLKVAMNVFPETVSAFCRGFFPRLVASGMDVAAIASKLNGGENVGVFREQGKPAFCQVLNGLSIAAMKFTLGFARAGGAPNHAGSVKARDNPFPGCFKLVLARANDGQRACLALPFAGDRGSDGRKPFLGLVGPGLLAL